MGSAFQFELAPEVQREIALEAEMGEEAYQKMHEERQRAFEELEKRSWPVAEEIFSLAMTDPEACIYAIDSFFLVYDSEHRGQVLTWLRKAVKDAIREAKPKRGRGRPRDSWDGAWLQKVRKAAQLHLVEGDTLAAATAGVKGSLSGRDDEGVRRDIVALAKEVFQFLNSKFDPGICYFDLEGESLWEKLKLRKGQKKSEIFPSGYGIYERTLDNIITYKVAQRELSRRFGFSFPQDIPLVRELFFHGAPGHFLRLQSKQQPAT